MQDSAGSTGQRPGPVRRLTFEYDGDQIKLVSDKPVTMIVPPVQPSEAQPGHGALSLVLRDDADRALLHVTRANPIRYDAEVFSPDGDRTMQRVPVERPKGAFTILVPDHPDARKIELIGTPLKPEAHAEPARSLATFALKAARPE